MRLVSRAAKRIGDENDAEAPVDRAEYGREHADIGFAAGDDDRIDAGFAQLRVKIASRPGRVDVLVEDARGRDELREIRTRSIMSGAEPVDGHRTPALVIAPPHAGALAGLLRRNEAREDGPLGMGGRDRDDVRQDARQPRHRPIRASREHPLHVDAEMDRVLSGCPVAEFIVLCHGAVLKSQLQRSGPGLVPA